MLTPSALEVIYLLSYWAVGNHKGCRFWMPVVSEHDAKGVPYPFSGLFFYAHSLFDDSPTNNQTHFHVLYAPIKLDNKFFDFNSTGRTLAPALSLCPHRARNSKDLAQNVTGKLGLSSAWCRPSFHCPDFHKHFPSSTLTSLWVTSQNSCHQGRRVLTSGTVISPPQTLPSASFLPPITANPSLTLDCDQDQLKPCLPPW